MASAHDFTFTGIDNKPIDLKQYAGKPVLVVNVASFCGFTPQYNELQKLHETYGPKGLVVLGVPSNDFGAQEPKSRAGDRQVLRDQLRRDLPDDGQAEGGRRRCARPLPVDLRRSRRAAAPKWNFHKYLIDKTGKLVGSWPSKVSPTSPEITGQIDMMLAG